MSLSTRPLKNTDDLIKNTDDLMGRIESNEEASLVKDDKFQRYGTIQAEDQNKTQESFMARVAKQSDSTVHFARTAVLTAINLGYLSKELTGFFNPLTAVAAHNVSILLSEAYYQVNLSGGEEIGKGIDGFSVFSRQLCGVGGSLAAYYLMNTMLNGNQLAAAVAGTVITYSTSYVLVKLKNQVNASAFGFYSTNKSNNEVKKSSSSKAPNDPFLDHDEDETHSKRLAPRL